MPSQRLEGSLESNILELLNVKGPLRPIQIQEYLESKDKSITNKKAFNVTLTRKLKKMWEEDQYLSRNKISRKNIYYDITNEGKHHLWKLREPKSWDYDTPIEISLETEPNYNKLLNAIKEHSITYNELLKSNKITIDNIKEKFKGRNREKELEELWYYHIEPMLRNKLYNDIELIKKNTNIVIYPWKEEDPFIPEQSREDDFKIIFEELTQSIIESIYCYYKIQGSRSFFSKKTFDISDCALILRVEFDPRKELK